MSVRRYIKRGFFTNETVAALPYEWRLLFAGLWTIADRDGRLEDRPRRIKGELFPYDDLDIDAGLGCLANAGLIVRYERGNARVIGIPTWWKHQRPHGKEPPSAWPPLPSQDSSGMAGAADHDAPLISTCTDPDLCISVPEAINKNTVLSTSTKRARFETFWLAYPRKVGKEAAWAVWERLNPSETLTAQMVGAIEQQRASAQWLKDGGQFIPHPRTWLHQGRWQDAPDAQPYLSDRSVKVLRGLGRITS